MQNFLKFEKEFHSDNIYLTYNNSEFDSFAIYKYNDKKVGIALINDSWRCSDKKVEGHYISTHQLHRCLNAFEHAKTDFNVIVMHHPLHLMNESEKEEIEDILMYKDFKLLLLGHEHKKRVEIIGTGNDSVFCTRGRSAFDKPHESHKDYQSGFSIIDIDFDKGKLIARYRIYDKHTFQFEDDIIKGKSKEEYQFSVSNSLNIYNKSQFINNSEDE